MLGYSFIFSRRFPYWLSRHLSYWLVFAIWYVVLCGGPVTSLADYLPVLPILYSRLPFCWLTTYITLYFLIPRYLLTMRYRDFFRLILLFSILYPLLAVLNPLDFLFTDEEFGARSSILFDGAIEQGDIYFWKRGIWDGWGLTMAVSGFAAIIKLLKLYHLENSHNKQLQEQRVQHEIQLLKSQLHSRFLFDTLDAIREHARAQLPNASSLILKLSDLLSYVLYESDFKLVLLGKEIEIIEGYLQLEKEVYGDCVHVTVTKQGDMGKFRIVPLVLLPLVESCFEDSAGMQQRLGIDVDFKLKNLILLVTLKIKSIHNFREAVLQRSIRVMNVKQRLASFYSGKHMFNISEVDEHCEIKLEIEL